MLPLSVNPIGRASYILVMLSSINWGTLVDVWEYASGSHFEELSYFGLAAKFLIWIEGWP